MEGRVHAGLDQRVFYISDPQCHVQVLVEALKE